MKILRGIDGALGRAEEWACVVLLLSILFLAVVQSLARNLVNYGMLWADVAVRQLTFYLGLAGAAVATREGRHINIDVLGRFLSPRLRTLVGILCDLFVVAACLWLVYAGYQQVLMAHAKETTPVIGPLYSWQLQLSVPGAFGLFAVHFTFRLIYGVARLLGGTVDSEPPPSAHGVSLASLDEPVAASAKPEPAPEPKPDSGLEAKPEPEPEPEPTP